MLLLENATVQTSFRNRLCFLGAQNPFHDKISSIPSSSSDQQIFPCSWKPLEKKLKKVKFMELQRGRLLIINAVATLEPKRSIANKERSMDSDSSGVGIINSKPQSIQLEFSSDESAEIDEREKLRRMKISKANKGNTPWNKGRKHSPETLQRIREKTRLAMQNPKVKMKLANLGHAQSKETRLKIGLGVKRGWKRRHGKQIVQETCYFEWQNLIAEAARKGYADEEEQQWDSYQVLDDQLEQEWLENVEKRKTTPRAPGSRRAPKSPEQRKKIAEAISAKWADPGYRERVCSGLAKYHGTPPGAERKPRRKPSNGTLSTRRSPEKKNVGDVNGQNKTIRPCMPSKRTKLPVYKDPLVSSKLEMIKNIRAQRAAVETNQVEMIERARLLIAEAQKAAKALEIAATKSPIAQASLVETRKLIAEAIQSMNSIKGQPVTGNNFRCVGLNNGITLDEKETGAESEGLDQSRLTREVNGRHSLASSSLRGSHVFGKHSLQELLVGEEELHKRGLNGYGPSCFGLKSQIEECYLENQSKETLGDGVDEFKEDPCLTRIGARSIKEETETLSRPLAATKKWVRGRLIEVVEEI